MSNPILRQPRMRLGRFAAAAVVCAGGLATAPAALAQPVSMIDSQVHRADLALHATASATASASANVAVPLSRVAVSLGSAAKLSAELAAHARTPSTAQVASSELNLVAKEEAKAQALLKAQVSAATQAKTDALVKADLQVTEAHQLALDELAQLQGTTRARADALLNAAATLKAQASSLLGKLVVDTTPDTGGSPPAVFAQLAAKESAKLEASITPDAATAVADTIDAGGSLLAAVTSDQVAQVLARVNADLAAQAQVNGSSSEGGSGSGSSAGSGRGDGTGTDSNSGSSVSGSVGASGSGEVSAGAKAGTDAAVKPGVSTTLGLGLGNGQS